jgi:hypothetical protein
MDAWAVLGAASSVSAEDPFGTGDPVEVARTVRRALAAAGRKAQDVTRLEVVTESAVAPGALARFTRRALGPHAAARPLVVPAQPGLDHEARVALGLAGTPEGSALVVLVILGPDGATTALCVG